LGRMKQRRKKEKSEGITARGLRSTVKSLRRRRGRMVQVLRKMGGENKGSESEI